MLEAGRELRIAQLIPGRTTFASWLCLQSRSSTPQPESARFAVFGRETFPIRPSGGNM